MPETNEVDRLRGAIREALQYAGNDSDPEALSRVWSTLYYALEPFKGYKRREDEMLGSLVDQMTSDDLWSLIFSQMAELREMREWQSSVNRQRREDRAAAEKYRKALEDIRDYGLRCDLNPTRVRSGSDDTLSEEMWWTHYLASADRSLRSRAAAALREDEA